jgi:RNA polymerase sigma-70 factor (ECF subfamily)
MTINYSSFDDCEVVRRAQSGDEYAFEELVKRYRELISAMCRRSSQHEVDDIFSEVWLKIFLNIQRAPTKLVLSQGAACPIKPWLMRVAKNTIIDWWRKWLRKQPDSLVDKDGNDLPVADGRLTPEQELLVKEREALTNQALNGLSPRYRIVLCLREIQGLEIEDVARISGLTPSAINMVLHRARNQMKKRAGAGWREGLS